MALGFRCQPQSTLGVRSRLSSRLSSAVLRLSGHVVKVSQGKGVTPAACVCDIPQERISVMGLRGISAFSLLLLAAFLRPGSCIYCYQCNSTDLDNPFQCQEFLTDDIDIEPQPCDEVYNAAYCIKHTGRFEGGVGTRRYCSSVDMGNYCNYIRQPGDSKEYRSCVFTCDSDGCNAASYLRNSLSILSAILLPTILGLL